MRNLFQSFTQFDMESVWPVQCSNAGIARRHLALWLLAGALVCLSACENNYHYNETQEIAGGNWTYSDTLDFRFRIDDTMAMYNLYLDIRYADTFATQNVYVKLHTVFPDGKRMSKQRSFDLFDARGQPLGECSGRTCRLHTLLQENAYFNAPGEYRIALEQYTRRDVLPGILSIGLSLDAVGQRPAADKAEEPQR